MHWTTGKLLRHFAVACTALASMVVGSSAAVAAGFTAQGIMPGDPDPNSIKLGDVEAAIRPRMFYKNTDTLTGGEQEAWALGGFAGFRTPWVADLFQFGVVGYTSQKLYGPAGKGGTLILTQNQDSITAIGEAWAALRVAGQTITAYRQLIDRPFINPQDTRELPNTFEAYTLSGAAGALLGGGIGNNHAGGSSRSAASELLVAPKAAITMRAIAEKPERRCICSLWTAQSFGKRVS